MNGSYNTASTLGLSGWKAFLPAALLWVLFLSSSAQSATLESAFSTSLGADSEVTTGGNLRNVELLDYNGLYADAGSDAATVDAGSDVDRTLLEVGAQSKGQKPEVAVAVPLPAAIWLFGSALVGFIMMANRHSV